MDQKLDKEEEIKTTKELKEKENEQYLHTINKLKEENELLLKEKINNENLEKK